MGCGSTPFHLLVLLQLIITNPKATPLSPIAPGGRQPSSQGNPQPTETLNPGAYYKQRFPHESNKTGNFTQRITFKTRLNRGEPSTGRPATLNPAEPSTERFTTGKGPPHESSKTDHFTQRITLKTRLNRGEAQPREPSTQGNPQPRGTLNPGEPSTLDPQPRGTLNPREPSTQGNPQPRGTFNPGEPSPLQPRGTLNPGEPSSPQPRGTFIPGESSPPQRRKSGPESSKTCREPRGPEKCLEHPFS